MSEHHHTDACYSRVPDTEGTGHYLHCGLTSGQKLYTKSELDAKLNEKRLWLCKELGLDPAHSWANIVETIDELRGSDESYAKLVELIPKYDAKLAELRGQIEEAFRFGYSVGHEKGYWEGCLDGESLPSKIPTYEAARKACEDSK